MKDEFYDADLAGPLLAWYRVHKRELPWRSDTAPYHVWVSEIMLQQTRVETVKPYYLRFIETLPDLHSLAACPEDVLLKLWEGLGYYSRVRNMQRAAVACVERHNGTLPETVEELRRLPGIGSYTAGAIASIAFGQKVPAVDGNVLRIVCRLSENETDIRDPKVRRETEQILADRMSADSPGDFNQALMDLGAMTCLANAVPLCGQCPLRHLCLAHAHKTTDRIPHRSKAKARRIEKRSILVIRDQYHTLLVKRSASGLLAGLYGFLSEDGFLTEAQAARRVRSLGLQITGTKPLGEAVHVFTHVEWRMTGILIDVEELMRTPAMDKAFANGYEIADAEALFSVLPVPSAFSYYVKALRAAYD